jgi:hypothetical protein
MTHVAELDAWRVVVVQQSVVHFQVSSGGKEHDCGYSHRGRSEELIRAS